MSKEDFQFSESDISKFIDHTVLSPKTTPDQLKLACEEAIQYGFKSVCVSSLNVKLVSALLKGTSVLPICTVGFPLGSNTTRAKSFETRNAIQDGAKEIDMVLNIGALKSLNYQLVYHDICCVVEAASLFPVKVIIETALLSEREKVAACVIAKAAGASFVKTSTGFSDGGALVEDVKLMREVVGKDMGVKASGGIRSYQDALKMIEAGANRIGASASVAIVTKKQTGEMSKY